MKSKFGKILLSDLSPCEYNPRKISKKRLDRLVASIRSHTKSVEGWDNSEGFRLATTVTVNRKGNRILGGHQRVEALLKLGQDWIHERDVTWVDLEPSSAEEKALNISLNDDKSGGSWDAEKLGNLLGDIKGSDSGLFEDLAFDALEESLKRMDSSSTSASVKEGGEAAIQVKDNLGLIVQEILSKYGSTVKNGFIFFAHKNKLHLLIQCDEEVYKLTKSVAEALKRDNVAINAFLKEIFRTCITPERWDDIVTLAEAGAHAPVSPEELEGKEDQE